MIKVNRKFFNGLANEIHDPKKKTFLRLCNGTLQNGPDPTNKRRTMHCGLGELYFAMTGRQPDTDDVDEDEVVALAVKRSTVEKNEAIVRRVRKGLAKLGLPKSVVASIEDPDLDDIDVPTAENKLKKLLDSIPEKNDDGHEDDFCSVANYKARSRRVAAIFRKAAAMVQS